MFLEALEEAAESDFTEFPKDSFIALIAWAGARSAQKWFGLATPDGSKPSYTTSEFWMSIFAAILFVVFPDIPQEALYGVLGWTGMRTTVKVISKPIV